MQFLKNKGKTNVQLYFFSQSLVIKALDPDPYQDQYRYLLEMLDPDPD